MNWLGVNDVEIIAARKLTQKIIEIWDKIEYSTQRLHIQYDLMGRIFLLIGGFK
jgi:hypothetical protein